MLIIEMNDDISDRIPYLCIVKFLTGPLPLHFLA